MASSSTLPLDLIYANMNTLLNTIDYINNSFEYPTLTKIHSYPTFVSLTKLKKQLKTNAKSVSSDLGDGANGHWGLVLTPTEYALVIQTPYVFPDKPGYFDLPRNTASDEAMILRDMYYEELQTFWEAVEVWKALVKQIVAAVDKEFLEEFRDEMTNDITKSVVEILTYLFKNFANVGSVDVQREEEKVKAYFWNISDPPMAFITFIEDLQLVATAAGLPWTEQMLINYGLDIIQKTTNFEAGLME